VKDILEKYEALARLNRSGQKVYLCGPINGCTDAECNDWRAYAKENLRFDTLDPMRRDYRGRELEDGSADEIVAGDEEDVAACDFILANCPKASWGTAMEIRMAKKELGKRVVVVLPPDVVPSPWLIHHSDIILRSMSDAVRWINGWAK
jgi:nucleoside 2-deoxyribosyltransferase